MLWGFMCLWLFRGGSLKRNPSVSLIYISCLRSTSVRKFANVGFVHLTTR